MKPWTELSADAREVMKDLGNCGPTVLPLNREVKGYQMDDEGGGKVYYGANKLRTLAAGMIEVADWLDARAVAPSTENQNV